MNLPDVKQRTDNEAFVLWCIYKHPRDYPDKFVVRRWEWTTPDLNCVLADTLEEARAAIPRGLVCLLPSEHDDPCVAETWI